MKKKIDFSVTDKRIISLLSSELFNFKIPNEVGLFSNITSGDWDNILKLSSPHSVTAILWDAIKKLPENFHPIKMSAVKWILSTESLEKTFSYKEQIAEKVLSLFQKNNIDFILIKGFGLASYYPIAKHRRFSDIDFYPFHKTKETNNLIKKELDIKINTDSVNEDVFVYKNVLFENHVNLINTKVHKSAKNLEKHLEELAKLPSESIKLGNIVIKLPSADFNAVFLTNHCASHFGAAEISLRHICDWGVFLKHEYKNINYNRVINILKEAGKYNFLLILNNILTLHFNMNPTYSKEFTNDSINKNDLNYYSDKILYEVLHPSFNQYDPSKLSYFAKINFKIKRFFAARWKYDLIYKENFYLTLIKGSFIKIIKPKRLVK